MHIKTLIPSLLTLTMVSCISKTNLVQEAIVFNPVIGHEVRSAESSVPFPEDKTFGVWALDDKKSSEFISNAEIAFNGGLWSSAALPLWPTSSSLTFYAYSPYDLPVGFSDGVMTLKGFDVRTDGDQLLYAKTASGLTAAQGEVKLPFTHALSRLDMRIASGYGSDVDVRIDRIVLRKVAQVGDFNSSIAYCWRADTDSADDIVIFDSERDGQFLAGPDMKFIGDALTIIPQCMGSSIEIHYAFRVDDGDWIDGQSESTKVLETYWEPGRYYTYSLTINELKLSYTTGIGHWNERK